MPLLSYKETLNLKLNSIPVLYLKKLALILDKSVKGTSSDIIKSLLESETNQETIDKFIKEIYFEMIQKRKSFISDEELKNELLKVSNFSWGVVQGQLDQKIQTEYVRKIVKYDELLKKVKDKLHNEITNYTICTWYNHWTTVL
ncbi:MAG: hypothetical protein N2319_13515 [Candidatus Kapabacteria bacterium]|nr:hypothetical protein [Candidatus Kapabacteria bacterium]